MSLRLWRRSSLKRGTYGRLYLENLYYESIFQSEFYFSKYLDPHLSSTVKTALQFIFSSPLQYPVSSLPAALHSNQLESTQQQPLLKKKSH